MDAVFQGQNLITLVSAMIVSGALCGTAASLFMRRLYQSSLDQVDGEVQRLDMLLSDSRRDLMDREERLYTFQEQLMQERTLRAAHEERATRMDFLEGQLEAVTKELMGLRTKNTELISSLEYERRQSHEKIQMVEQAQMRLTDTFRRLSSEALSANNQSFLHLANTALEKFQEKARMDLGQRQQAIVDMMHPIHQALHKVDGKIVDLEKERVGAYEVLRQQVSELVNSQKELRCETSNLVKALRAPSVRGQWGEIQLKRVVEMAGMISHCDFVEQVSASTDTTGRVRPDMIVNLPGGKKIIVDAKAPLSAYLEALETQDEQVRQQKMADHARHVRTHIRQLSQKAYWDQFRETPEFVVLFLPGETFFSAALENDPSLIEVGVKEKVILATPTTLIALLRAVAYGWRQEAMTESTKIISELGKELYKRVSDMGEHFSRLGKHLSQSVDCYNQTLGTLERRVLVTTRKFKEIDSVDGVIDDLVPIDNQPRHIQSLELSVPESSGQVLEPFVRKDAETKGEASLPYEGAV
jgi:DNA recombination protein RmuC